ncbi:hypothetical protein EVAR_10132_1 [Eumeta japonica]|uniref:Uncharacterized protein n=1 Tax=Eumeta variegata TaxID=151549 RepID=A0A4C1UC65_EUMVA|nr:hypothetical protein EVAR_10132_1 [Eumeta japonica]
MQWRGKGVMAEMGGAEGSVKALIRRTSNLKETIAEAETSRAYSVKVLFLSGRAVDCEANEYAVSEAYSRWLAPPMDTRHSREMVSALPVSREGTGYPMERGVG